MKTNFSHEQLQDPNIRRSNDILRKCVHCGFCTATCPTYIIQGDELDSPRGRIWLIRDMLENNDKAPSQNVVYHIDRCISCLACTTTCPSGVDYGELIDHARDHIERQYQRPLKEKMIRTLLATLIPKPKLFRFLLKCIPKSHTFLAFLKKIKAPKYIIAMIELVPKSSNAHTKTPVPIHTPLKRKNPNGKNITLLEGCVQPALRPNINHATARVLRKIGYNVTIPKKQTCCGAVEWHIGKTDAAKKKISHNIAIWKQHDQKHKTDAFISNASGCGAVLKHYPHILADDPHMKQDAENISKKIYDISEFITQNAHTIPINPDLNIENLKIACHTPCSIYHAQKIRDKPIAMLENAGFTIQKPENDHLCCGAGGVYNILQKDLAEKLRKQKIKTLEKLNPDIIVSSNIGCINYLQNATKRPVMHVIELIDQSMK